MTLDRPPENKKPEPPASDIQPVSIEKERSNSAGKYFKEYAFEKYIKDIDSRITRRDIHRSSKNYFKDEEGEGIIMKLRNDADKNRVLISYKLDEGNEKINDLSESNFKFLKEYDKETSESMVELTSLVSRRLSPANKRGMLLHLSNYAPSDSENSSQQELFRHFISYFPETEPGLEPDEIKLPFEDFDIPQDQAADITKTVSLFLQRFPTDQQKILLDKINDSFRLSQVRYSPDNPSANSNSMTYELISILKSDLLTETYESENDFSVDKYELKDKIKNNFSNPAEVQTALGELNPPLDLPPNLRISEEYEYELVDLSSVVGGVNMQITSSNPDGTITSQNTWEISSSQGRGLGNIYELCKTFQTSQEFRTDRPISYVRTRDGKYYIYGDGRHRTAALKILGVDRIPAIVYDVSESEI